MNNQEINDDSLLRKFLNPGKIEKAPDGFTSKTMTRIHIETQTAKEKQGFLVKNRVPVISAVITAGLILAAALITAGDTGSVGSAIWKYFQDLKFTLPVIDNKYFNDLNLPEWVSFALIGILLLGLFDRALFGIFHRWKAPKSPKGDLKLL
ncbi:MAG TPA: hypothetical protein DEO60_08490 [Bacteroidales bacterium]|nr:hypothetical protein [Bacteroidales bacterium]HBZ21151.1 hypothetical protein [Bacteroidales bacterium]